MADREKLIEWVNDVLRYLPWGEVSSKTPEEVADHLISNGVTVRERGGCNWCSGEYHTRIMATAIRYHSSGNMDGYELPVNFCPNCGADMRGEEDG